MEAVEFLGGKYREAELVVPGAVQTYRAREASNGRAVFVHRVSVKDPQQNALLAMLRKALLSSADARKLIVEFGDEQGYWHVVTQAEDDCLLLKPWLEEHSGQSTAPEATIMKPSETGAKPVETGPQAPPPAPKPPAAAEQSKAVEPAASTQDDTGEFTRFFKTSPRKSPAPQSPPQPAAPEPEPRTKELKPEPAAQPGEFTRLFQTGSKPAEEQKAQPASPATPEPAARRVDPLAITDSKDESTTPLPGEFTRLFHPAVQGPDASRPDASKPAAPEPPTPSPAAPAGETSAAQQAPGEFTRLFGKGASPSPRDTSRNRDRPSRGGFVQRPGTPMPPIRPSAPQGDTSEKVNEPGEFTRLFSSAGSKPPENPAPSTEAQPHAPGPPQKQEPGEFTRLFSTPVQQPSQSTFTPVPNATPNKTLDPFARDAHAFDTPMMKPAAEERAGEFTRLFGSTSGVPVQKSPAAPAPPPAPAPAQPVNPEPLLKTQLFTSPPAPAAPPPPKGPSEYTMITGGGSAAPSGSAQSGPSAGAPGASAGAGFDPAKAKALAQQGERLAGGSVRAPHLPPKPQVPPLKVPAGMPPGAALKAKNNKLVVFFIILGALAVVLVVLILLILKK